jgi:hypothetical protein
MSEIRTLLLDPQSHSSQRTVFTIAKGLKVKASKIRLCNFNISNSDGNQLYFNHSGIYSLLSKISVVSLQGSEIDRLSNMEIMAIRLMHLENASQYSINRQLSQNMCDSVYVNNLGQVDLTEQSQRDDASLMSQYIDVSFCLKYLQQRTVIDEGMTVLFEWETADNLGFNYQFVIPPALAVDEYLTDVPTDGNDVITYTTIIQDKLVVSLGSNGFEKRLNAFFNNYITNVYFIDTLSKNVNPLKNAVFQSGAVLEITIDGRKVIPLKGIDHAGKKLGFLQDFSGKVTVPGYDSTLKLNSAWTGLQNPNLGIDYENKFSYGCFLLNRFINMDFTLSYNFTDNVTDASGSTLLILAEVLRSYDRVNDKVSNITSPSVPA